MKVEIEFVRDIVGHNVATMKQMYSDWLKSPLSKSVKAVEHDLRVSGKFADTWQKCPKCNGQGIVSKPPYVAGDVYEWSSTSAVHTCDVCNGAKIIKR